ncbi:hypothetical protein HPB47_022683 [Ixodes persulcatus]|uniref:Uncharacterized protein n=1 Tax=Ixodes persulcatus TaxID=34615 RepID=A0AC60Q944_IXOPE|nr:hypothetical protein HPB47_022683 [Ixodes persulcatus]
MFLGAERSRSGRSACRECGGAPRRLPWLAGDCCAAGKLRDILEKEHHIVPTVLLAPGRVVEKEGETKGGSDQRAPAVTSSKRKRETALGSLLKVFADMEASRKQRHKDRMTLLERHVTAIEKSAPAEYRRASCTSLNLTIV